MPKLHTTLFVRKHRRLYNDIINMYLSRICKSNCFLFVLFLENKEEMYACMYFSSRNSIVFKYEK